MTGPKYYTIGLTIEAVVLVEADEFATAAEIEAIAEQMYVDGDWIPEDHYFDIDEVLA